MVPVGTYEQIQLSFGNLQLDNNWDGKSGLNWLRDGGRRDLLVEDEEDGFLIEDEEWGEELEEREEDSEWEDEALGPYDEDDKRYLR